MYHFFKSVYLVETVLRRITRELPMIAERNHKKSVDMLWLNNNNNNSNFFCANILENQAQWRDKTRGLINLIIESNA